MSVVPERSTDRVRDIPVREAASRTADDVLAALGSGPAGLAPADVAARRAAVGPNTVRVRRARALAVLARQLRSALLVLLLGTAVVSFAVGERINAVVIGVILAAGVGIGFANEYRAERTAEALHRSIRHRARVVRDGSSADVDVADLVPGDVVRLVMGAVVPADLRLLESRGLECDEAVLTGETVAVRKSAVPTAPGTASAELASCAFMGTVVGAGAGTGVVVTTGKRTEFGRIALGLAEREPETAFQAGLRRFSLLLLRVAGVLMVIVLAINVMLNRPLLDAVLFSLAIGVGITPQLLPAVVSTGLSVGSRRLAARKVLVKRLVCIEDLGDMDVLVTDKTGTLTEGRITFSASLDPSGHPDPAVLALGLLATETDGSVGSNAMDAALQAVAPAGDRPRPVASVPFDHERRMTSVLVDADGVRMLVVKGAPESVLARCRDLPPGAEQALDAQFSRGARVVAVAWRPMPGHQRVTAADERDLDLAGFLAFLDSPKADAAQALATLAALGIAVKVATGDNPLVARRVCAELGLGSARALTGADLDTLDDAALRAAMREVTVFARVSPEHKARLVRLMRADGHAVGFLGDGVNDALALHAADVGLSVDTAADVAKDAADVLLLEKDLGVLADGVAEGRRIFANTIKYVLMGTSSNFGNMFSAAAASAVLPFLPMLPSQILLNNLLYDAGQLTIPTDRVDAEQLLRPSHWDMRMIRRFMLMFGPVSSLFDFLTFGILLGFFTAGPELFRSGWFVESLATQTLVIVAIRTRRVPFFRSRPSGPLLASAIAVVAVAAAVPYSPLAGLLGFTALPAGLLATIVGLVLLYLVLIEVVKKAFYAEIVEPTHPVPQRGRPHRVARRLSRFTHGGPARSRRAADRRPVGGGPPAGRSR
ncbi:magnesium-translocating P-type ATPase [Pseudonocardia petroleophila]|uniref:magnesium-translocating P-type ATPase n=1 Tax=Pseudonocardia petroleophila TaxID=37331 RepID=UPI0021027128|nr:magnesium-translocating P-type ATPase [Pseudonocardia petroleophila]